jgi:hypothetical protein
MTPSELKQLTSETEPHFFTHTTMKFFGDKMKNYGVRSSGENWELYRKHPVKHGLFSSAFFNKKTFKRVIPG